MSLDKIAKTLKDQPSRAPTIIITLASVIISIFCIVLLLIAAFEWGGNY